MLRSRHSGLASGGPTVASAVQSALYSVMRALMPLAMRSSAACCCAGGAPAGASVFCTSWASVASARSMGPPLRCHSTETASANSIRLASRAT